MLSERRRVGGADWMPVNVFEEEDAVVVTAAIPGARPEDVEVDSADNVLDIRGRVQVPQRQYLHQEMRSAEYRRQVALPGDVRVDQAEAAVENGILSVRVPKARPRGPDKIRIQVNRRDAGSTGGGRTQ